MGRGRGEGVPGWGPLEELSLASSLHPHAGPTRVLLSSVYKSHKSGHKTERPGHVSAVTQLVSACWGGTWSVCLSSTTARALLHREERFG